MGYDYTKVSRNWYLNNKNLNFVQGHKVTGECSISIPFYLWEHGFETSVATVVGFRNVNGQPVNTYKVSTMNDEVCLRNTSILFNQNVRDISIFFADKARNNAAVKLSLDVAMSISTGRTKARAIGASYVARYNGNVLIDYHQRYTSMPNKQFRAVSGLSKPFGIGGPFGEFYWGLSPYQLKVYYVDRYLGESYGFVCGTYAIILDDDLSFDALVVLSAACKDAVRIEKVLYTTNPYLVKCITMMG